MSLTYVLNKLLVCKGEELRDTISTLQSCLSKKPKLALRRIHMPINIHANECGSMVFGMPLANDICMGTNGSSLCSPQSMHCYLGT